MRSKRPRLLRDPGNDQSVSIKWRMAKEFYFPRHFAVNFLSCFARAIYQYTEELLQRRFIDVHNSRSEKERVLDRVNKARHVLGLQILT